MFYYQHTNHTDKTTLQQTRSSYDLECRDVQCRYIVERIHYGLAICREDMAEQIDSLIKLPLARTLIDAHAKQREVSIERRFYKDLTKLLHSFITANVSNKSSLCIRAKSILLHCFKEILLP